MRPAHQRRGFTLVELMIGSALAAIVMAALLSSFVFIGRNLSRLASSQALENEARKAFAYLRQDFATARAIKSGTTPTASSVTLLLPSGEVSYTYDSSTRKLRRQTTASPAADFYLLGNDQCICTSFAFSYYTSSDGSPTSQLSSSTIIPYSVKQVEVGFVLESPTDWARERRARYEAASSRFLIRNRTAPDGT